MNILTNGSHKVFLQTIANYSHKVIPYWFALCVSGWSVGKGGGGGGESFLCKYNMWKMIAVLLTFAPPRFTMTSKSMNAPTAKWSRCIDAFQIWFMRTPLQFIGLTFINIWWEIEESLIDRERLNIIIQGTNIIAKLVQFDFKSTSLPIHAAPFFTNPSLQSQRNEPGSFAHSEFCGQRCGLWAGQLFVSVLAKD